MLFCLFKTHSHSDTVDSDMKLILEVLISDPKMLFSQERRGHSLIIYLLRCTQCDVFYVGETKNSLSTRMNGHRSTSLTSSSRSPHQISPFLFNSSWNVLVPLKLTATIINSSIDSFCPQDTAFALASDNFLSIFPTLLSSPYSFLCWPLLRTVTW